MLKNPKIKQCFDRLLRFTASPWARRAVLGLFVVQAVVLVFVVRIGTPPDELNHIKFIEYYAEHSLSPVLTDQEPTYNLGDKTREVDYFYHYTMSFLYRILPMPAEGKYTVIRLLTVLFALLCFVVLAKVFRRIGFSETVITVGLLVVTNLPMVLMMSSAVNNDVLVWLGAALGFLLLLNLWKRPSATGLLWLGVLVTLGGLTKRNLLPFCLAFGLVGLFILLRHFRAIFTELKRLNVHLVAAAIVLLVSLGLFAERVGGNLVRYGGVTVSCEEVHGEAACADFWASIRARNLEAQPKDELIPPAKFIQRWFGDSFYNIVDIQTQAWRHEVKPAHGLPTSLAVIMVLGIFAGVVYESKRFKRDQKSRHRVYILLIAIFFVMAQLAVNYSSYRDIQVYGIALNGRYILPSLLVLIGFAAFYWSKMLGRYPKVLAVFTLTVVLATIFGSGLILMLRNPQLYNG